MKKNLKILAILCLLLTFVQLNAQTPSEVNTVQPSIMLIPLVKKGQDIRTIIEDDFNIRIGFTKINEAFNQRDFSTVDFRTKLVSIEKKQTLEMMNQDDFRKAIMEESLEDFIVTFDMEIITMGNTKEVVINLNSIDSKSGQVLSSEICRSGQWSGVDITKLTEKAIESKIEVFLNTMNSKFGDMVENGRNVIVNFTFDQNSEYNMYSEVGEDYFPLSDALELWFEENAYKNYYKISSVTESSMRLDEVRIPLKDPVTGNNYTTSKFALKLYVYLKKELGLECEKDFDKSDIYITIK